MKKELVSLSLAAAFVLGTGFALAQPGHEGHDHGDNAGHAHDADQAAMMEAWMKAGAPGEQHQKLAELAGTWDAVVKHWGDPSQPPAESKGVTEATMALGGRYLEERFQGEMMGAPFHGIGYTAYDNVKGKYIGIWMDTMSTGVMMMTGTADASGKKMMMSGSMDDAFTKQAMPMEHVITIESKDKHTFEMFVPGPDGKMWKTMEIVYTRKA